MIWRLFFIIHRFTYWFLVPRDWAKNCTYTSQRVLSYSHESNEKEIIAVHEAFEFDSRFY